MTILWIIIGVLVIAGLLYLGRRRSERMRHERAVEREKLEAEARGHRSMLRGPRPEGRRAARGGRARGAPRRAPRRARPQVEPTDGE